MLPDSSRCVHGVRICSCWLLYQLQGDSLPGSGLPHHCDTRLCFKVAIKKITNIKIHWTQIIEKAEVSLEVTFFAIFRSLLFVWAVSLGHLYTLQLIHKDSDGIIAAQMVCNILWYQKDPKNNVLQWSVTRSIGSNTVYFCWVWYLRTC